MSWHDLAGNKRLLTYDMFIRLPIQNATSSFGTVLSVDYGSSCVDILDLPPPAPLVPVPPGPGIYVFLSSSPLSLARERDGEKGSNRSLVWITITESVFEK